MKEAAIESKDLAAREPDTGEHGTATARGLLFMLRMAVAIGLVAGVGAWGFRMLIGLVHNVLFLGQFIFTYDANAFNPPRPPRG